MSETTGIAEASRKTSAVNLDISREANLDSLNPAELLLAAFGGCLLKNISKLAHKMRLRIDDVRVDVTGERTDEPPRIAAISYKLILLTEEPKGQIERLAGYLHAYGTVYNTLVTSVDLAEEIMLERENGRYEQLHPIKLTA